MAGFEEQLVGMKVGENREIKVTLPQGYRNADAAGKERLVPGYPKRNQTQGTA
jgi:trigger factor